METQDDASSSSVLSGCFASITHLLVELISKLRNLFRERGNAVQQGENATSNRRPARNSQVANQTTMAEDKLGEASLELISAKARVQVESSDEEEEDVCPTCLEDYDHENPKITTRCSHHFHLGCIYEWKERSDRCPICYRVMVFDETS